jgi:cytochrome c5
MRALVLVLYLAVVVSLSACARTNAWTKTSASDKSSPASEQSKASATETKPSTKVDFATQIKPVLQTKCQPCHFSGGQVYSKMPFDRPETIKTLGTKLFTRIKDENERRLIREFLAQE